MRLHLLGLPHSDGCPFAVMVGKFAQMVECTRYGTTTTETGYQLFDEWDPTFPIWQKHNGHTIAELAEHIKPGDAIATIAPWSQQPVIDAYPNHMIIEFAVGYPWQHPRSHRAYASHAWRHYLYGKNGVTDGRHFDTVIPHPADPDDYEHGTDGGYLLYLGRMTGRKGLEVVEHLASRHRVITAGFGDERASGAEHLGVVTEETKRELLAHASAVLMPTQYLEPFGTVAVEAMMSGIPVISTDFGSFPELVENDVTGWRCNTLTEFYTAADKAPALRGPDIRKRAVERFSLDTVGEMYHVWLDRLELLNGPGWYS